LLAEASIASSLLIAKNPHLIMAAKFQIKLAGEFKDYNKDEDTILKRAYMAGFPTARFTLRGQNYTYDFARMVQVNRDSGKERKIRQPRKWRQPSKPLVPAGPTTVVTVPKGTPGKTIQVPYPGMKGACISVNVPASAKAGQAMLVPVPPTPPPVRSSGGGWSTGGKVAAGTAAFAGVAGAAVGGVILGEHIAEHGFDATVDAAHEGIVDAAEAGGDFAADAGDFIVDAADDVGDFVMDLF